MAYVPQGGITATEGENATDVYVRSAPGGPFVDADELTLTIRDPDGDVVLTRVLAQLTRLSEGHYAYGWTVAEDQPVGAYTFEWDAVIDDVAIPTAVDTVLVTPAGSSSASVVTPAMVRVLVRTAPADDAALQALIDREEAVLAAAVGQLVGERTETFRPDGFTRSNPVRLKRPTSAVTVTEDSVATTDILLAADGLSVARFETGTVIAASWGTPVAVTYTPNDRARIETWLIELVRARLTETGYMSETIGSYNYQRGNRSHDQVLSEALAEILGFVFA